MDSRNSEAKTTVIAKDGIAAVLHGAHIVRLVATATQTFVTNSISDFVSYVKKSGKVRVFYSDNKVEAVETIIDENTRPTAICWMKPSRVFSLLESVNGKSIDLGSLETTFRALIPFMRTDSKELFDVARDLRIRKVTQIERKKDNNGNFAFSISRKGDRYDQEIPAAIHFELPVLAHCDNKFEFELLPELEYRELEDSVSVSFRFHSIDFEERKADAIKAIIADKIAELTCEKYFGTAPIEVATDERMYRKSESMT